MIINTENLVNQLEAEYSQPINRISYMLRHGELFPLKRGLYTTTNEVEPFIVANALVEGSYISFETALSYYQIIPEGFRNIGSATTRKRKTKIFKNNFGCFIYWNIPFDAFVMPIDKVMMNNEVVRIASKEKAIMDTLYRAPVCANIAELEELLYEFYRMEEDVFDDLNVKYMINASNLYKSKNLDLLKSYLLRKLKRWKTPLR